MREFCAIPRRLAVEREELVVHRFPSGSIGFACPSDLRTAAFQENQTAFSRVWRKIKHFFAGQYTSPIAAIYVAPGALLILKDIPARLQRKLAIWSEEGAMLVRTRATANTYGDALQFQNGRRIPLQRLCEGQRLEVLSFAAADFRLPEQPYNNRHWKAAMPVRQGVPDAISR